MIRTLLSHVSAYALVLFSGVAFANDTARFHYQGHLTLIPEKGSLVASWQITAYEDDFNEFAFVINGSLSDAVIEGPDVVSVTKETMDMFTGPASVYKVTLKPPAKGEGRTFTMRYSGVLFPEPPETPINTLDEHKIEFTVDGFWMPFDRRFDSQITADIQVKIPGNWDGIAMQDITKTADGFHVVQSKPSLDVAFSLLSNFKKVDADDYVIFDAREPAGKNIDALISALDHCTQYLNKLAGSGGPLPSASILVTDRSEGGYSRGTLIALTDIAESSEASLLQFICHELGHYWSFGNSMTVENWINESFADYVAIMGMRDALGEEASDKWLESYQTRLDKDGKGLPPVWTPTTTERPPYLVAYRKGPLALEKAEAMIGREAFQAFMSAFMQAKVTSTPQMLEIFEGVAGAEARLQFEAILAE